MKLYEIVKKPKPLPAPPPEGSTTKIAKSTGGDNYYVKQVLNYNPELKPYVRDVSSNADHKYVGAGVNAYVHRKDTPHDMDAVYRTSKNTDTTALYLEYIYNHPEIQNNPFFPKIIQSETGTSGIVTHIVERLVPFDTRKLTTNNKIIESLLRRYFGFAEGGHAGDLTYFLRHKPIQDIKDEQLKQALTIIHNLAKEHDAVVDIHEGNVMWRLTVGGPQLVIVDPLFAGWHTLKHPSHDQKFY